MEISTNLSLLFAKALFLTLLCSPFPLRRRHRRTPLSQSCPPLQTGGSRSGEGAALPHRNRNTCSRRRMRNGHERCQEGDGEFEARDRNRCRRTLGDRNRRMGPRRGRCTSEGLALKANATGFDPRECS